jgi:DNA primase
MLEAISDRPHITTASLLEIWRDEEEGAHLRRLADPAWLSGMSDEGRKADFLGVLDALIKEAQAVEGVDLYSRASPSELDEEEKKRLRELFSARSQSACKP